MNHEALTDEELRVIVATSSDERTRRAARRALNARSDAAPMPARIGPPDVDWSEVDRRARVRVHTAVYALGRSLTHVEAHAVIDDVIAELRSNGR